MIFCLSMMSKSDGNKQLRWRFRFRAAFSLLVFAGLMPLMPRAAQAQEARLVKNINLTGSSNPQFLTDVNGTLYFSATDAVNGTELWKSDGTSAGTVMVKNINLAGSSNPQFLTDVNGTLYFSATDAVNGTELWKSDGTSAGTVMVKDINPGIGDSNPENLTDVNGTLYFSAADAVNGTELWTLGSNTTNPTNEDEQHKGCFIVTAGNAWFSTHDIKPLRKSRKSVLFTVSGSKAIAQPCHAWSSVMADFIDTCNFVRTVLSLSLLLTSFGILICFTIVRRGKADPVSNHQERKGRGA